MTEHVEDLRSDLSVFHRVDDLEGMPARRFFGFVVRLPAYQGVLAARMEAERQEGESMQYPNAGAAPKRRFDDARQNPELAPYIEGL